MTNEEQYLQTLSKVSGWPLIDWVAILNQRSGNDYYRLYFLPMSFKWPAGLIVTLSFENDRAMLEVVHTRLYENLLPEWRQFIGSKPILYDTATTFAGQLKELGVWNLADCHTNTRHGLLAYHVVASQGQEHCFIMSNPQLHNNRAYTDIIDLYSKAFFQNILLHK